MSTQLRDEARRSPRAADMDGHSTFGDCPQIQTSGWREHQTENIGKGFRDTVTNGRRHEWEVDCDMQFHRDRRLTNWQMDSDICFPCCVVKKCRWLKITDDDSRNTSTRENWLTDKTSEFVDVESAVDPEENYLYSFTRQLGISTH